MACDLASGFHGLVAKYKPAENLTVVLSAKHFSGSQGLKSHDLASQHVVLYPCGLALTPFPALSFAAPSFIVFTFLLCFMWPAR